MRYSLFLQPLVSFQKPKMFILFSSTTNPHVEGISGSTGVDFFSVGDGVVSSTGCDFWVFDIPVNGLIFSSLKLAGGICGDLQMVGGRRAAGWPRGGGVRVIDRRVMTIAPPAPYSRMRITAGPVLVFDLVELTLFFSSSLGSPFPERLLPFLPADFVNVISLYSDYRVMTIYASWCDTYVSNDFSACSIEYF